MSKAKLKSLDSWTRLQQEILDGSFDPHTHSATLTVVVSVTPVTSTIYYKDHSGVNQSMVVVTGVNVSTDLAVDETGGIA